MALSKKETKKEEFSFNIHAKNHFRKEFQAIHQDFDKFLLSKGAVKMVGNKMVVLEYSSDESQSDYRTRYVNGTPYYFLDLVSLTSEMKRIPYTFWSILKHQAFK